MISIITGITGQDGSYLAKKLIDRGHQIIGVVRKNEKFYKGLDYLNVDNVEFVEGELDNIDFVNYLVKKFRPNFYYNLAAQSSVSTSFKHPQYSILFNINSTLNALEAIRNFSPQTKFYQATSSEMFGSVATLPINEDTLLHPQSPYAISKAACHHLVRNYRESYDLNACSGILFNHESVLRRKNFFIMKVIQTALDIKNNKVDILKVGNVEIKRDFGYAPAYVDAMILMMEQEIINDYIICSGTSIRLFSVIEKVFSCLGISMDRVIVDEQLFRPSEISDIYGDNTKAKNKLNWNYNLSFYKVVEIILEEYQAHFYER